MKKTPMILTGVAAVAAIAFWLNSNDADTGVSKSEIKNETATASEEKAPHKQHLEAHHHAHPAKSESPAPAAPKSKVAAIEAGDYSEGEAPFAQSETAEQVLKASGKLRENLRGEVYLEIDNEHLASLEAGDTLKLEVPFFDMYHDAEVEKTDQDRYGNKTLYASFAMNDHYYNTTITINDNAVYGHINTPYGIYSLAGDGRYAWMAESSDLVHGAIPDQLGPTDGDLSDGSEVPSKPIDITGK